VRFSLKLFGKFSSHYYPEVAPKKNWYRRWKNLACGFVFFGPETRAVLWSRSEKERESVADSAQE
jgi:hypothetical protein